MYKYKVNVYAISKNEEKFVDRWVNSMKEADNIYVLDTGSKDNTVSLLKKRGVIVKVKEIIPWRFDVARNISLEMVDKECDICVCTDLDELFVKGWRENLEKVWENNLNRLKYNYNWSLDKYNKPIVNFYTDKIHSRNGYKWINPVHEILQYKDQNEIFKTTDKITLNHYPDKTKSRKGYLKLMELSVLEDPNNDRNMHYLGREYMYYGYYNKAIATLIRHLNLKNATWNCERCASMRFIARCYKNLKKSKEAKMWLELAIKEAPFLRDPYVEMAFLECDLENYKETEKNLKKALQIKKHDKIYMNEVFSWDHTIYDLLSISLFYQEKYQESFEYISKALKMNKESKRLQENFKIIKKFVED